MVEPGLRLFLGDATEGKGFRRNVLLTLFTMSVSVIALSSQPLAAGSVFGKAIETSTPEDTVPVDTATTVRSGQTAPFNIAGKIRTTEFKVRSREQ